MQPQMGQSDEQAQGQPSSSKVKTRSKRATKQLEKEQLKNRFNPHGLQGHPAHYLWRCSETAYLARRNGAAGTCRFHYAAAPNVVIAPRRKQSQKPDEVYGLCERLVPGGRYLELFGREHNLRPGWLTIGDQLLLK